MPKTLPPEPAAAPFTGKRKRENERAEESMPMERVDQAGSLANTLYDQLKDTLCTVKLMRGQDHLGMARMEVEDVYVDDRTAGTTVFRIVGRHPDATDHSMLGMPLDSAEYPVTSQWDDDHVALKAGEFEMVIHPYDQHLAHP